jgi:formylglycine-generating enzyme required for sulfatase activity
MVMVYVPGGTFMMGSDTDDNNANSDEMPQHEVTLTSFWIDKTEVTNAQYALCVADGTCEASFFADAPSYNGEEYPVVGVSWEDANNYCGWADVQLPTEAQWEFAARGEDGWIYPWGNEFDGSKVNYCDTNCTHSHRDTQQNDGYELTAPVSSYHLSGNSWVDAADMAGNVQEWVSDWYGDYSSSPQTNPAGPYIGSLKVLRGGGWGSFQSGLRGANRHNELLTWRWISVGFRCAVVPSR